MVEGTRQQRNHFIVGYSISIALNMADIKSEVWLCGQEHRAKTDFSSLFDWFQQTVNSQSNDWTRFDKTSRNTVGFGCQCQESVKKQTVSIANEFAQQKHNDLAIPSTFL